MIKIISLETFKDHKGSVKKKRANFSIGFSNGSVINGFADIGGSDLGLSETAQKDLIKKKSRKIRDEIADILDVNESEISEQGSDWNEEFD